ncbi:MAG TPA: DUF1269 domain-containing protein, partial [Actinomycetota bacterium]|nr:DUF1269 domain-containing protein [Actinomycetota bacterium]
SELIVVGAVVMDRAADGSVDVKEHGATAVAGGTALGAVGGLVVGLFAPPLLLATAVGAGIGAGIGELEKRHQEKKMGVEVEEYLPPGTSAVVVLLDDACADRVEKTLGKASKSISKAVDSGDVDAIQDAITKAGGKVEDSLES